MLIRPTATANEVHEETTLFDTTERWNYCEESKTQIIKKNYEGGECFYPCYIFLKKDIKHHI